MEEKVTFKMVNDEGVETECELLFTFESEETHKNYMCYTDNTTDEEGNIMVYGATFDPDEEEFKLSPLETDEEWTIIRTILDEMQKEAETNSEQ